MTTRLRLLLPLVLPLASCDSENVSWAFVSNPGGSFSTTGGAVIVIRFSSSSSTSSPVGSNGDWLRVDGFDQRGALSVFLPHVGDFAVLSRSGSVELRSPALSFDAGDGVRPGRVEADGATLDLMAAGGPAALRLLLPDTSIVHPGGVGPGVLHVAANGTLLILESGAGLVLFGEDSEPEIVGLSATLTTTPSGNAYALLQPNGVLRFLVPPPLPQLEQRVVFVPERDSVRILGPIGEVLAEIPQASVTLHNGAAGLFLTASLPDGLPGDPGPMQLSMTADNRYLLRVDQ